MRRELIGHLTKTIGQDSTPKKPIPVYYQSPRGNNKYTPKAKAHKDNGSKR